MKMLARVMRAGKEEATIDMLNVLKSDHELGRVLEGGPHPVCKCLYPGYH